MNFTKGRYMNMENVTVIDHPLVQHKISRLRDKNTGTNEFRTLIEEIATLMGYEALRDLPLEDIEVETPIERCMTPVISGKKLAVVQMCIRDRYKIYPIQGVTRPRHFYACYRKELYLTKYMHGFLDCLRELVQE